MTENDAHQVIDTIVQAFGMTCENCLYHDDARSFMCFKQPHGNENWCRYWHGGVGNDQIDSVIQKIGMTCKNCRHSTADEMYRCPYLNDDAYLMAGPDNWCDSWEQQMTNDDV